ncbi:MAG: hypothetical protein IKD84_02960 [Erysipelotrichaceae bacterium]|nr:hypothetical protein [Erysipelotrichaceae bacterium]
MAAIAYVSDDKMLDFHRINGSQEIVFWRLSTKKFSSFQPGDLLFFLSKGMDNTRHREKGIVGYGCFVGEKQMSVRNLWHKYNHATGYKNKEDLVTAIMKTTKNNEMPEKISCLFLKDVIFFQGPIYLSELGIKLPSNLESFTYLDAHEGHVTLELLQKVKQVGIDSWSAALNNREIDMIAFDNEILKYQIATIYEGMDISAPHRSETFQKHCFNRYKDEDPQWVNNEHNSFVTFGEQKKLYYIYTSTNRDNKENFIKMLGQLVYIRNCLNSTINEQFEINILTNVELMDIQRETLLDCKFNLIRIN